MSQLQSEDIIFSNYGNGKQTFIISLTFTDISDAKDIITGIGYGGDIWELRVDLLSPPGNEVGDVNLPSLDYVKEQVEALQAMSSLPILFTIRTKSQGGKFPDDASKEALDLILLAIASGISYVDVEIDWPPVMLKEITEKKSSTKSWPPTIAGLERWDGRVKSSCKGLLQPMRWVSQDADIIKLSILSPAIEDCYELGLFVRDYKLKYPKPLLAVGMGANGQLSRITSPISLVTHPLIPFPSAPGQLSLAQVHQARHLIGKLPKQKISVVDEENFTQKVSRALQAAFLELGYPHLCSVYKGKMGM
ncbi:hypothetical protein N7481_012984 [Penicillium waksmanii]|uniref:uncharacterized protein n=1 Tax=Penicillium waksmanii TaxID=69791 RepID=UPI0025484BC2|nr:uncharacterized protein N7481_012984 [Penicillium waksmanii]KAJ5966270.1 hypothetical protein N7481_012984 [Penicillium waksmanii]